MKQKTPFQNVVDMALIASRELAQDFPSWTQPLIKVVLYIFTLVIFLLLMPFVVLSKWIQKPSRDPFVNLRAELETIWKSESNLVALTRLRNVYQQLEQHIDSVMGLTGYTIVPYGKFRFYAYDKVRELLYYWELQHHHWQEAQTLCDTVLNVYLMDKKRPLSSGGKIWIIRKARTIANIEGKLAAQQYLLPYIAPELEESPIREYFYELRESNDPSFIQ